MELSKDILSKVSELPDNGTARYLVLYENGKCVENGNSACHADLCFGRMEKGAVAVVNKALHKPTEHSLRFFDYLINRSIWADVFITKDPEIANTSHQILNTDTPVNLFGGACIAARTSLERSNRIDLFSELVRRGLDEGLSYALMSFYKFEDNGKLSNAHLSGHHPFSSHSPRSCWGVFNKEYVSDRLSKTTFKSEGSYEGVHELVCAYEGDVEWISHEHVNKVALTKFKKSKGQEVKKVSLNIFAKEEVASKRIPKKFYYDALYELYKDFL